ncbi:hypothetical protein J6590_021685 [Homalodisca vitripennis]|nr:hypothetical protein J6590_021685 [Homalodisca vitripennis]
MSLEVSVTCIFQVRCMTNHEILRSSIGDRQHDRGMRADVTVGDSFGTYYFHKGSELFLGKDVSHTELQQASGQVLFP